MMKTELQIWAADESERLEKDATIYGDLALRFRRRANIFELLLSILTLASGTSGVTGLFSMPWVEMSNSVLMTSVISILMALVSAYVQIYSPRQKEYNHMKANSVNTALSRVTDLIAETYEPNIDNLCKSIISTLESAFEDENPYLLSKQKDI